MWEPGVKRGLLGAFAAAALLAGCGERGAGIWSKEGHVGSLAAQEDYYPYPEQAQDEVGWARSNIGTTSELFLTNEQVRGTGRAGEVTSPRELGDGEEGVGGAGVAERARIQGRAQEHPWLRQDERTLFPPPSVQTPFGTGKPLRTGPSGAWVQGTYTIELGAHAGVPGKGVPPLAEPGWVTPRDQPTSDGPRGQ